MSALPPKADIAEGDWNVRFVPKADIDLVIGCAVGTAPILDRDRDYGGQI
jgi:hypothetical protein